MALKGPGGILIPPGPDFNSPFKKDTKRVLYIFTVSQGYCKFLLFFKINNKTHAMMPAIQSTLTVAAFELG